MDPAIVDKKIEERKEIIISLKDGHQDREMTYAEAQKQVHSKENDVHR